MQELTVPSGAVPSFFQVHGLIPLGSLSKEKFLWRHKPCERESPLSGSAIMTFLAGVFVWTDDHLQQP
jgi:hypothetical protein